MPKRKRRSEINEKTQENDYVTFFPHSKNNFRPYNIRFFLFELITAKKMERRDTRDVCGILRIYAEESDYYHDLEKFSSWKTRSSEWKGGCAEEYEEEKIFKKTTYSTTYGECGILLLKN